MLTASFAVSLCGCGPAADSPERRQLERQRLEVAEQWADTLGRAAAFERSDLDKRQELTADKIGVLEGELGRFQQTLAKAQTQRAALLNAMESPDGPATQPVAGEKGEWPDQLQGVRVLIDEAELSCAATEQRLFKAREELANLKRMSARRDLLVRMAAEQEKQLRAIDKKLGK